MPFVPAPVARLCIPAIPRASEPFLFLKFPSVHCFHGQKQQAGVNRTGAQAGRVGSRASKLSELCLPWQWNSAAAILGEGAAAGWELKGFCLRESVSSSEEPDSVLKYRWHQEESVWGLLYEQEGAQPWLGICMLVKRARHKTSHLQY